MESRFTSREQTGVCFQKLARDRYFKEGAPETPHLEVGKAVVKPVSYRLARQIILKYEWLGKMGSGVNRSYGIFFGSYCAGVTTWTVAGHNIPAFMKTFRLRSDEIGYLVRGACVHWAPKGTNSRLIGLSLRLERKRGTVLAMAFADEDAGEIGTVYQATNWVYLGRGCTWFQFISPAGELKTSNQFTCDAKMRHITTTRYRELLLSHGWKEQQGSAKHRYAYLLDGRRKNVARKLIELKQSYPKRVSSIGSDASGVQLEEGGASPTGTLQLSRTAT